MYQQVSQHPGKSLVLCPVVYRHDHVCLHAHIERINSYKTRKWSLILQVISVFSKYYCLSAKLCDFILPLEQQASFNGPTLAFDTWHSLQALLCLPLLAHEIFTASVPTGTLGQHLCSALFCFSALTSGI